MYKTYGEGIVIRDAKREDMDAFHGVDRPSDPTIRAWVGEKDGEVMVIGGLARGPDARWFAFFDITEKGSFAREHQILIGRFARQFVSQFDRLGHKYIYATVDQSEENAVNWMERLGFHLDPRTQKLMRWKKGES